MVIATALGTATYADYFATPEGERWELIDGVLYQMAAAPNIKHQIVSGRLGAQFDRHIEPRRLGFAFRAPGALLLPGESAVEPDLFYVSTGRRRILTERACEGAPDLVAEILSPSNPRHDLVRKRELYARHGVPEYWMLEPYAETLLALTEPIAGDGVGEYAAETIYRPGDTLTTAAIPGLVINVADIFADPW